MSNLASRATRAGLVVALAAVTSVFFASPAHAARPTKPCTLENHDEIEIVINSAEVNPVLTHFVSINITEGTTGERTETLTVMDSVTTSIGGSIEISAAAGGVFAKVGFKVGFSVQRTTSSTTTETTSMRWNFNEPGYYGLYKGTRAVSGTYSRWRCNAPPGSIPRGRMWLAMWLDGEGHTVHPYTTFANLELGTIKCDDQVPPGSLREKARLQLGC